MSPRDLAPDLAPTSPPSASETTSPLAPSLKGGEVVSTSPRDLAPAATYDLRLWLLDAGTVSGDLAAFVAEVRELAEAHPNVSVRWTARRVDRDGGPRIRRPRRTAP